MTENIIQSEQLNNRSDYEKRSEHSVFAQTKKITCLAVNENCSQHRQGILDRVLQAVWKVWMQMRERSWPWAKILPFHKLSRKEARNGLHSLGSKRAGGAIHRQFSKGAKHFRGNLLYQSGNFATQGTDIIRGNGHHSRILTMYRCGIGRGDSGQYGSRLIGFKTGGHSNRGGEG